jgi:hypothetical protein
MGRQRRRRNLPSSSKRASLSGLLAAVLSIACSQQPLAQEGEVVPPRSVSESTASNGDRTIVFSMEEPDKCTGAACNSSGVSEGGVIGSGGGGGGSVNEPGVEPGGGQGAAFGKMIMAPGLSALENFVNNAFGKGGAEADHAKAIDEIHELSDFLSSGRYQATEAKTKQEVEAHWTAGHFFSQQQLQTQNSRFEATAAKIREGSFKEKDVSSVVQHAPATEAQLSAAVQKQLAPLIQSYSRMAEVCGPDGMCRPEFYFNAGHYVDQYSELARKSEEPNFEKYVQTVESGVDSVSEAVKSRYENVVNQNDGEDARPPLDAPGGLFKALSDLGASLRSARPTTNSGKAARQSGLRAVNVGNDAARRGKNAEAEAAAKVAKGLLDVAIGMTPIVGFARDVYEASVGEDALTGEKLTTEARLFAAMSAMTVGIASEGKNIGRVIGAISENKALNKALSKVEVRSAELVNSELKARYALNEPPYRPGTRVYRYEAAEQEGFVRVYNEAAGNKRGPWVLKSEHIKGLSPQQIATKYSLPSTPTHMAEVIVERGQAIERGAVNKAIFEGDQFVAYQYRLLDIAQAIFKEGIPLPIPIP